MDELAARATARWRAIDPLLPDAFPAGGTGHDDDCGAVLAVGHGGNLAAFGTCRHSEPDPGEIDLSWGMARRFELAPRVVGPDAGAALGRLIGLWRDHLADTQPIGDDDTAAIISWPSRDIEGVATLQRHGLRPLAVVAIRPAARPSARAGGRKPSRAPARDTRIRRAGPADVEAVATFGTEVARFDAHFSGTPDRAGTGAALRHEAARLLAAPGGEQADPSTRPWTWLAEKNGRPVGVIATQRPDHARWIAPMTRLAPVAYTVLGYVSPQERSGGVGAALAASLHAEVDPAGVAATLLHYEQLNPYAAPFWSRQGYRPLWTIWEARPAWSLC
jgi:GNAT superfamily N-acetyltransferase